ncbi:polar amino acid transport system permease protein [Psychromicrobium silvestre]|uniref:Polar amino acid transport system permease protein n=1 Tax=Psychromicrobium silvestre TaxID=1645614 RepID=A0A7Y9LTW9_9MICC|nr:polar amino acid transport system permease protein [Psychromicrobium silvestre]
MAVVVIVLLAVAAIYSAATNQNFHWDLVTTYFLDVLVVQGVGWTLLLTVLAMVLAIVLALLLAIMRQSDNWIFRWVSWAWVWFFRGTPVYTQLLFWGSIGVLYPKIAMGVPFGPELFSFNYEDFSHGFWPAVIGLGLNESAYLAEIFRAGLKSVDNGQMEAAEALGMRKSKIMLRIILPQAMRVIVPPTGNETIGMLKTTSLVLAVPFTYDLTFVTNAIANRIYFPIPLLVVAALWYLIITSVLMVGQFYIERYFGKGVDNLVPAPVMATKATAAAHANADTTGDLPDGEEGKQA